jgi:hypothetical protein
MNNRSKCAVFRTNSTNGTHQTLISHLLRCFIHFHPVSNSPRHISTCQHDLFRNWFHISLTRVGRMWTRRLLTNELLMMPAMHPCCSTQLKQAELNYSDIWRAGMTSWSPVIYPSVCGSLHEDPWAVQDEKSNHTVHVIRGIEIHSWTVHLVQFDAAITHTHRYTLNCFILN